MLKTKNIVFTILIGVGILIAVGAGAKIIVSNIDGVSNESVIIQTVEKKVGEATTTVNEKILDTFNYKDTTSTVSTDFIGYATCRLGGYTTSTASSSSEADCKVFLNRQRENNKKWAREGIDGQKVQEIIDNFANEVQLQDLKVVEITK